MNVYFPPILFFIFSLLFSYFLFPAVLFISRKKNIYTEINYRSSHLKRTPVLGGIVFYFSIVFSFFLYGYLTNNNSLFIILISLTILLLIGVKDDLLPSNAFIKLIYQTLSVIILILLSDFRIQIFDYWTSVIITLFFFLFIINSFNLIDGIDGLAALICFAFIGFSSLMSIFTGNSDLTFISFVLLGVLISYLRYNFSKKKKIFMGDTGSMILGFLIAYLFVYLLNSKENLCNVMSVKFQSTLIILLFYPICDTLRIFFYRILIKKVNPFKADKNHIHHRYISLGFKHWEVSLYIFLLTVSISLFNFFIVENFSLLTIFFFLFLFILLLFLPFKFFEHSKKYI
jgi:UDP-N-acetylmuramyl pentapeptide phosphotransferase/UDP-N-acetylglucosamine-1-phosphate transferase